MSRFNGKTPYRRILEKEVFDILVSSMEFKPKEDRKTAEAIWKDIEKSETTQLLDFYISYSDRIRR